MANYDHDSIIEIIRRKGPSLPSDVHKELGINLLFASAVLGEIVSSGKLKVTNLKRGSSPYYFLDEQKEQLQYLAQYLDEKDKAVFNLLKEKRILKDSELTPLMRASLRMNLKDFAVQLNVNVDGQVQIFWKWYLLPNQEAEQKIKISLGIIKEEVKKEAPQEIKREIPKEIKKEEIKKPIKKKVEHKKEQIKEEIPQEQPKHEEQQTIVAQKTKIPQDIVTSFLEQITKYFADNHIIVHNKEVMNRQKTEFDFIIEMPSPVGNLKYYCKARDKKKITDGDIASAMLQGQQKRLPTLVLINGEMTKKTKEMLNNELKGVAVYKI